MKQRSIFFPLVLIASGVLWLLISLGRIPLTNLWALGYFWPFLLIATGLGLIIRSYWAPARILLEVLIVGAGSATVRTNDALNASLSGTGSIRYYGNPNLSQQISGLGSIKKIVTTQPAHYCMYMSP